MSSPDISRRTLLTAALAWIGLAASGCRHGSAARRTPSATPPGGPAGASLLDTAVADEEALLAAYDTAIPLLPAVADLVAAARADHVVHRDTLLAAGGRSPTTSLSPSSSAGPGAALRALLAAEHRAAGARGAAAVTAPRELAALLGSIAAAEASHGTLLHAAARRLR